MAMPAWSGRWRTVALLAATLVVAAVLAGYACLRFAGHETPRGQPRLVTIAAGDLGPVEAVFDGDLSAVRIIVMLSPT